MDQKQNSMEAMIERYKTQLMDMKKQAGQRGIDPGVYTPKENELQESAVDIQAPMAASESPAQPPIPPDAQPDTESSPLDKQQMLSPEQDETTTPPMPRGWRSVADEQFSRLPTQAELTGQGYIKVQASIANGAMPISGAQVSVRQDGIELVLTVTDENGETEEIPLKAPSKALSEQYETVMRPYSVYDVFTDKDGYVPVRNLNVPVFDGIVSIQSVNMRRLPEDYRGEEDTFDESVLPRR